MKITPEIIEAINKAKDKVKKVEASLIPENFRVDSAWLGVINDIVDRIDAARNKAEFERVCNLLCELNIRWRHKLNCGWNIGINFKVDEED